RRSGMLRISSAPHLGGGGRGLGVGAPPGPSGTPSPYPLPEGEGRDREGVGEDRAGALALTGGRPALALAVGLGALALFALRAPWGEWGRPVVLDDWDRRFAHEHAPWPYVEPDGVQVGAARVLAYQQLPAVAG